MLRGTEAEDGSSRREQAAYRSRLPPSRPKESWGRSSALGARRWVTVGRLVLDGDECAIHHTHWLYTKRVSLHVQTYCCVLSILRSQ